MTALEGFLGYVRADGRVGTRNRLLVLSVTGLTGPAARRIAGRLQGAGSLALGTPYGGGLIGADRAAHRRTLKGLASHPNVGALVVIGADPPTVDEVAGAARKGGTPTAALTLDSCDHDALTLVDRAVRQGAHLAKALSHARREPVPLSALTLGLECGRSDPSSGLVANPLIGAVTDQIVAAGGTAIFGETLEWLGAEDRLMGRSTDAVGAAIHAAVARREALAVAAGVDLTGTNPSRTNIDAGLSTIEEKSLGAVAKSGAGPVAGLVDYAAAPDRPGLFAMDAPAYAPESLTGFVAAGATLILFATGVGNSYGSALAPTLKITGNPASAARLSEQIDFDAAAVFEGHETHAAAAKRLMGELIATASGRVTFAEILADQDEVFARYGEAL